MTDPSPPELLVQILAGEKPDLSTVDCECLLALTGHNYRQMLLHQFDLKAMAGSPGSVFAEREILARRADGRTGKPLFLAQRLARDLVWAEIEKALIAALQPDDIRPEVFRRAKEQLFRTVPYRSHRFFILLEGDYPVRERVVAFIRACFPSRAELKMRFGFVKVDWKSWFELDIRSCSL